jgi:hypothetical protein
MAANPVNCPFCKKVAMLTRGAVGDKLVVRSHVVKCMDDGCPGHRGLYRLAEHEAVDCWNRRAPYAVVLEQLALNVEDWVFGMDEAYQEAAKNLAGLIRSYAPTANLLAQLAAPSRPVTEGEESGRPTGGET